MPNNELLWLDIRRQPSNEAEAKFPMTGKSLQLSLLQSGLDMLDSDLTKCSIGGSDVSLGSFCSPNRLIDKNA
jgi:hypothetical protein